MMKCGVGSYLGRLFLGFDRLLGLSYSMVPSCLSGFDTRLTVFEFLGWAQCVSQLFLGPNVVKSPTLQKPSSVPDGLILLQGKYKGLNSFRLQQLRVGVGAEDERRAPGSGLSHLPGSWWRWRRPSLTLSGYRKRSRRTPER
jgi:hypothetical protein